VGQDVWDSATATTFRVYGYAAFRVVSISTTNGGQLTGYFLRTASQADYTTPPTATAPDLGARSIFLTKN
jgi:hypothetical protein